MHRDFKIGLAVGVLAVSFAAVWLCTRPKLGAEARARQTMAGQKETDPGQQKTPVESAGQKPHIDQKIRMQAVAAEPSKQAAPAAQAKFYIVQKGDTLSAISEKYYGSANKWQRIFTANRDVLENPDRLTPGSKLVIPE